MNAKSLIALVAVAASGAAFAQSQTLTQAERGDVPRSVERLS